MLLFVAQGGETGPSSELKLAQGCQTDRERLVKTLLSLVQNGRARLKSRLKVVIRLSRTQIRV